MTTVRIDRAMPNSLRGTALAAAPRPGTSTRADAGMARDGGVGRPVLPVVAG
jgi:hypothetical protein